MACPADRKVNGLCCLSDRCVALLLALLASGRALKVDRGRFIAGLAEFAI